jgi:hypothetical protein
MSVGSLALLAQILTGEPLAPLAPAFEAPAECASVEDLRALVRSRLPPGVDQVPEFRAKVAADGPHFVGHLQLNDATPRRLEGASCIEVLDAMAIILALRAEQLHEEAQAAASADEPAAGWLPETESPKPEPPSASIDSNESPFDVEQPEPETPPLPRRLSYRFGVGGVALPEIAPAVALGAGASAALQADGSLAWLLKLSFDRSSTGEVAINPASMWARLTAARVTGCVMKASWSRLTVRPCLQLAGGIFTASGVADDVITSASEITRPWVGVGPAARAELQINRHFALAAEAAAPLPLVRQSLKFQSPNRTIYESAWISSYFGLVAEFIFGGSMQAVAGIAQ